MFPVPEASEFSSPVGDHGKHSRSQLVLTVFLPVWVLCAVGVSSCDPTRHRVTVLVVLSVDLMGVERTRGVPPYSTGSIVAVRQFYN